MVIKAVNLISNMQCRLSINPLGNVARTYENDIAEILLALNNNQPTYEK
jgi:hypothetical protein